MNNHKVDLQLKTGTTTVAVMCKDGIVVAADKRVTAGNQIVNKNCKKIHIIDNCVLTISGVLSSLERQLRELRLRIKMKSIECGRKATVHEVAHLLAGLIYKKIRKYSTVREVTSFILGGYDPSGIHLYNLHFDGSLMKIDDFVATGSGSVYAYGTLETLYKKDMSIDEGKDVVVKAVDAAISRDNCSGNGIDVVVVKKDRIIENG